MSAAVRARRRRLAVRAAGGGVAWSLGLLLTGLLVPLYNGQTSSDATGLTLSRATYVQRTGAWVRDPAGPAAARRRGCSGRRRARTPA